MKIRFTKQVIFHDLHGNILRVYEIGDECEYYSKSCHYWISPMGGIYFDEAEEVEK